jgi:hypothetical protein
LIQDLTGQLDVVEFHFLTGAIIQVKPGFVTRVMADLIHPKRCPIIKVRPEDLLMEPVGPVV